MLERMQNKSTYTSLIVGGVVLFAFSAYVYISTTYLTPGVVFQRMLDRSLQTTAFTRSSVQSYDSTSVANTSHLIYAPVPYMTGTVEVQQAGSSIKTELFGTQDRNYVRYATITPDAATDEQKQQIEAVSGQWAVQESAGSTSFLQESVYNLIPIAHLSPDARKQMLQEFLDKGIYTIDSDDVLLERHGTRLVYTMQIKVAVGRYASIYQSYAEKYGLGKLALLEATEGQDVDTIVTVKIDALTARLTEINTTGSGGKVETINLHNAYHPLVRPNATLSVEDLQSKLQGL